MRVAGEPEGVRAARERVMAVLDTRVSPRSVSHFLTFIHVLK